MIALIIMIFISFVMIASGTATLDILLKRAMKNQRDRMTTVVDTFMSRATNEFVKEIQNFDRKINDFIGQIQTKDILIKTLENQNLQQASAPVIDRRKLNIEQYLYHLSYAKDFYAETPEEKVVINNLILKIKSKYDAVK